MKIYPIQQHELANLSTLNSLVTFCWSVASAAFAFMLSILWDIAQTESEQVTNKGISFIAVCAVIMVVAIGLAVVFRSNRKSALERILEESE